MCPQGQGGRRADMLTHFKAADRRLIALHVWSSIYCRLSFMAAQACSIAIWRVCSPVARGNRRLVPHMILICHADIFSWNIEMH